MALNLIALLHGPDQPGLVAQVASWIFKHGGNIIHADQHRDQQAKIFFQRIEWHQPNPEAAAQAKAFQTFVQNVGMQVQVYAATHRPRIAIMVSHIDHCYHDILLRWQAGELPGDIVAVLSNHPNLAQATQGYGLPFFNTPVSSKNKPEAEAEQIRILHEHQVDVIILARYMQILTPAFLAAVRCPIINIHHSFLPAFIGAKPYHQAFARGVKLIGATAHYATPDLDEGPIIHQDVAHVTHRHTVSDLICKGRDLEKIVLAQAVRWHLENRVLVYHNKTVVFD